jgi:KaiC/GvpD/RAD55 family RecA-like ATPase
VRKIVKDHNEDCFFWLEKDKIKLNIMTMITTFLPAMDFFFLFVFL